MAFCICVSLGSVFPAPQAAGQQGFDATVAHVRVDVIVMDGDDRFVSGLDAEHFRVFEDGVEQRILEVQFVAPGFGAARRIGAGDAGDPATRVGASTASADQGAVVFVVDGLNTGRRSRSLFARQWAGSQEHPTSSSATRRAAYLLDGLGKLHELAPLSIDGEAMYVAAERVYGKPIGSDSVSDEFGALATMMSSPLDPVTQASRTYDALSALCDALGSIPGRKTLIWVSEGVSSIEVTDSTVRNDHRIKRRQRAFHQAANTAGVSVYGLDPSLVTWRGYGHAGSRTGPVDVIVAEATGSGVLRWDDQKDGLIQTARATGGKAFTYSGGNIDDTLRAIEEDAGRYYLLTYATPEPVGDGLYHEIRVEVDDPDLDVRARHGYLDLPARARHERALGANARRLLSLSDLTVVARAYRRWGPSGGRVLQVAAKAVDAQGRPDEQWDWFHAVGIDEDGRKVGEAHLPVGAADPLQDAQRALLAPRLWPSVFVRDLSAPTGAYRLTIALADEAGGRVGATHLDIDHPEDGSWQTSDLMLAVHPRGNPAASRPLLEEEVASGDVLSAYVEVRGGEHPVLSGTLERTDIVSPIIPLDPVTLPDDSAGIHRGALRLRLDAPGAYLLRVSVTDAEAGETAALEAQLEVIELR